MNRNPYPDQVYRWERSMSGRLIVPGGLGDTWTRGTFSWPGAWNKRWPEEYLGQWAPEPLPERDPFEFRLRNYMGLPLPTSFFATGLVRVDDASHDGGRMDFACGRRAGKAASPREEGKDDGKQRAT